MFKHKVFKSGLFIPSKSGLLSPFRPTHSGL